MKEREANVDPTPVFGNNKWGSYDISFKNIEDFHEKRHQKEDIRKEKLVEFFGSMRSIFYSRCKMSIFWAILQIRWQWQENWMLSLNVKGMPKGNKIKDVPKRLDTRRSSYTRKRLNNTWLLEHLDNLPRLFKQALGLSMIFNSMSTDFYYSFKWMI